VGYSIYDSTVRRPHVELLVNNVGRSHDIPVYFNETTQDEIDNILTININSTLRVTQIVLPSLIARYAINVPLGGRQGFKPSGNT